VVRKEKKIVSVFTTHHVNPRLGTLVDRRLETTVAVAALASAPGTLVLGVSRDTQGAVRVLPVGAQDLALVQSDVGRVHEVVSVPHKGDGRLVLARIRLVRVLKFKMYDLKNNPIYDLWRFEFAC